jgi:isoleucyl-tRNA synthetase
LAKDGKKLSKSSKNYTDPMELMKKFGTDAFRLYLYQTKAMLIGDLLFDDAGIQDSYQQFILPYWNACNFFISYANIDGFHASEAVRPNSDNLLDQWILAKLYDTEKTIRTSMDRYQVDEYVGPIASLLDGLTNWYIRRSRRRFWASEFTQDKKNAYETLYYVLVNVTKLLAPVAPIVSEKMYKLLTGELSVHLADWEEIPESYQNAELLGKIETVQSVIALARNIRNKNKVKNRQPLSLLRVASTDANKVAVIKEFEEILKEELNIKHIEIMSSVSEIATMKKDPNFNVIREKYPKEVGQIIQAVKSGKYEMKGDVVECNVGGEVKTYDKEIILITYLAKDGLFVASDFDLVVSLDLTITEELKAEGLAREMIRGIQDARKQIGCEITDKIAIFVEGDYPEAWMETVCKETLSSVQEIANPATVVDVEENGATIKIAIAKL